MKVACTKIVMVRMIEIYGEVTGWHDQKDMNKYTHRRYKRSRVKDGTHLNWKARKMVVPINETSTREHVGLGDQEKW